MARLTDKQKENYYRKRKLVKRYILDWARQHNAVVYGATGLNIHLPSHLKSVTRDIDMFVRNPKISAHQLEKYLDEVFQGDYFETSKAEYENTYKVRSRVSGQTRADLTKPKTKIASKIINGIRVATISQIKKNRKRSLRNPQAKFRHSKDKEALQRIRLHQKQTKIPNGFTLPTLKKWSTRLPMKRKIKKKEDISLW